MLICRIKQLNYLVASHIVVGLKHSLQLKSSTVLVSLLCTVISQS